MGMGLQPAERATAATDPCYKLTATRFRETSVIAAVDREENPTPIGTGPEIIITLIHGTFAQQAEWIRSGSALRVGLESTFGKRILLKKFRWSGKNTIYARMQAGHELVEHIKAIRDGHSGVRQMLVAHSHGGNVALYALRDPEANVEISGLACIATPFLHAHTRDSRFFDGKIFQGALYGLWVLGIYLFTLVFGLIGYWQLGVAFIIGSFITAALGGFLAGALPGWKNLAP
jgi:pimeloyl-ACP methyl ester carboxylesterase